MNNEIMSLILQAEKEYQESMKKAVREAEVYSDECSDKRSSYIDELEREWELFKKSEDDRFKYKLAEDEEMMEAKKTEMKGRLRARQEAKADMISERLKKEVLSLYGDR